MRWKMGVKKMQSQGLEDHTGGVSHKVGSPGEDPVTFWGKGVRQRPRGRNKPGASDAAGVSRAESQGREAAEQGPDHP